MKRRLFTIKTLSAQLIMLAACMLVLNVQGAMAQLDESSAVPPEYAEQDSDSVAGSEGLQQQDVVNELEGAKKAGQKKNSFSIDKMPSLFFTYWQHQSIIDAKNAHGKVRPPTEAELAALESGDDLIINPGSRYVSLGGIVYNDKEDWTIWLNGKRVQPDAIPKEVLNLEVFKDYIEIKWHDEYTNKIFPLRLRSHQRFNMDMRIFLPG